LCHNNKEGSNIVAVSINSDSSYQSPLCHVSTSSKVFDTVKSHSEFSCDVMIWGRITGSYPSLLDLATSMLLLL
jgi:hypothetical protein